MAESKDMIDFIKVGLYLDILGATSREKLSILQVLASDTYVNCYNEIRVCNGLKPFLDKNTFSSTRARTLILGEYTSSVYIDKQEIKSIMDKDDYISKELYK